MSHLARIEQKGPVGPDEPIGVRFRAISLQREDRFNGNHRSIDQRLICRNPVAFVQRFVCIRGLVRLVWLNID